MNRYLTAAPILVAIASTYIAAATAAPLASTANEIARWGCLYIPGAGTFCGDDGYDPDKRPEK